ncbi:MAG TPA: hypothetical protein VF338_01225, partial [Leptolinea sp.]
MIIDTKMFGCGSITAPEQKSKMTKFQNILWGYEIEYPDFWTHQQTQDLDVFVASTNALDLHYQGPDEGQIMVRGEWNWA